MTQDRHTILLVEDEALIAMSEAKQLGKYGYDVVMASNGNEAIETARTYDSIDLILMDIDLGKGMDGTEAAAVILHERDIPVVFLSSHTEPAIVEKTEKITSYGYVVKNTGITVLDASIKMAFKLFEANQTVKRANENLGMAQAAGNAGTWDWDIVNNVFTWSPEFLVIFGMPAGTVAGFEAWSQTVHPDDREAAARRIQEAIDSRIDLLNDYRIVLPSGKIRWIRATGKTYYANDRPVRMMGLCMDITERKKAEERLRESEEKYRLLHEQAGVAIGYYTPEGVVISYNERALDNMKMRLEEVAGKSMYDLFPRADADRYMDRIRAALAAEGNMEYEDFIELPIGQSWFSSVFAKVCDDRGKVIGVQIISRDVTEKKKAQDAMRESEQRFSILSEASYEGILIHDHGRTLDANSHFLEMFGYTLDELKKMSAYELIEPEYRAIMLDKIARGDTGPYEVCARRKDGSTFIEEIQVREMRYHGDQVRVAVCRDISERKRVEEMLRIGEERYKKAQEIGKVGSWEYDLRTTHFWGSDEAKRIYGFDPAQDAFTTDEVENCIPERERVHQALMDLVEKGKEYNLEFEIRPRDSSSRKIIRSIAVLQKDDKGNPVIVTGVIQDITGQKTAEMSLEAGRRMQQEIIDSAHTQLVYLDRNFNFVAVNEAYARTCNMRPEEMVGKNHFALYPHEENEAIFRKVRDSGEPVYFRDRPFVFPDQPERGVTYWDWALTPVKDGAGAVEGLVFSLVETTERKRAEEELLRSRDLLDMTQQLARIGGWEWDVQGRTMTWTDETYRIHGMAPGEPAAGSPEHIDRSLACYDPADRPIVEAAFRGCAADGRPYDLEFPLTRVDGRRIWIRTMAYAVKQSDRVVRIVGNIMDITGRKAAEEALREERHVFMGGPTVVFKWRAAESWPVEYVSPNVESVLGYPPGDLLSGRVGYVGLIHPDDCARVLNEVVDYRASGDAFYEQEYRLARADGHYRWFYDYTHPVRGPEGEILYYHGYIQDITERKEAEIKLGMALHRAESYLDTSATIMVALENSGTITMINRYGLELLGYKAEEIVGRNWFEIALPQPEGVEQVYPVFLKIVRGELESARYFENEVVTSSGERRLIAWSNNHYLDDGGRITGTLSSGVDITEHRRAEKERNEMAERLRLANKATNDVIWDWDVLHDTQQWNEAGTAVFGWTEIVERPVSAHWWVERVHPDDRDRVDRGFFAVVENPALDRWQEEYRFLRADGTYAHVMDRGYVLRDAGGRAVRMIGAMLDITGRREAELQRESAIRALHESESHLRYIFDNAIVGMFISTPEGRFRYANREIAGMLGYDSPEDLIESVNRTSIADALYEDPEKRPLLVMEVEKDESSWKVFENRYRRKDGSVIDAILSFCETSDPVTGEKMLYGFVQDVTVKKRAEERIQKLQALLEETQAISKVGGWEYDVASGRMTWTSEVYAIYNVKEDYDPNDIKGDVAFYAPEHAPAVEAAFRRAVEAGEPYDLEAELVRAGGERIWVRTMGNPQSEGGKVVRVVGNIMDITDRKRAELARAMDESRLEALLAMARMEATTVREVSDFTLEQIVTLTGSAIGFLGFLDQKETEMTVHAWSLEAMKECAVADKPLHFDLATSGVWADAVKERRAVIVNDYGAEFPGKKGIPSGHVHLKNLLSVPVMDRGQIVAVAAVANKPGSYDQSDIRQIYLLTDGLVKAARRIEAETSIRASEERFRAIYENAPVLIDAFDEKGRCVQWNNACRELFGWTMEEINGHDDPLALFYPDPEVRKQVIATVTRTPGGEFREWHPVTRDGRELTCLWANFKLPDGTVMNVGYDITGRKAMEERLRTSISRFELLAMIAGELLGSMDPRSQVEALCRRVMEHMDCQVFFNYLADEKAGMLRLNAYAGIPEEEVKKIEWLAYGVAVCGCVARDGKLIVAEHIPSTPDERTDLVRSYGITAYAAHPLFGEGGKVIGTLSFGTKNRDTFSDEDISLMRAVADHVSMAMIRKRTEEDLKRTVREKELLMSELKHRVKNNLALIEAFLELELDDAEDGKIMRVLADAKSRVHTVLAVYEQLHRTGETGTINLGKYLADVADSVMGAYEERAGLVRLDTDLEEIDCDVKRAVPLGIILNELMTNSFKYAYPHGSEGDIRVTLAARDNDITFTVADDGPGLPAGFDISATESKGLKMVALLARQIGGVFIIKGAKGAEARVTFPLRRENAGG